jgi:hypothetical protein
MKKQVLILVFSIIAMPDIIAQINPLGLFVDIDGKVKFWENEANENGSIDDTVYISFNGETLLYDLRNLKYNYLTLIEAPSSDWITPSNLDPSRINDTSQSTSYDSKFSMGTYTFGEDHFSYHYFNDQSLQLIIDTLSNDSRKHLFSDESRGAGLTDSVLTLVKSKLNNFVNRNYGKSCSDEELEQLQKEISSYDTVIDYVANFDYIVDLIITYDYDKKNRLTKVLGYHWNHSVEVDSLEYDNAGNLSYFSREQIGSGRREYFFKYDKSGRVTIVKERYRSEVPKNSINIAYTNDIKFKYNKAGTMISKAVLQDGKWLSYYFEIKNI